MSLSSNTLYASDVTVVPIKLRYSSSFSGSISGSSITTFRGESGSISLSGNINQDSINYLSIKHLYYSRFFNNHFPNSSSMYENWLQSTAASGALDADRRAYPVGPGSLATAISIPREKYGENIARYSFVVSSSLGYITDDGNGNLVDITNNTQLLNFSKNNYFSNPNNYFELMPTYIVTGSHVGNIIYSQGMAIITDGNYEDLLNSLNSLNFYAESTIYENTVRCRVSENDFNYTLNPSANKAGSTGSYIDAVTGSDFRPYATTVGLYNQQNELLLVGKLGNPTSIPSNTDLTFVVRWDS
jgi:hypothetical protein